MDRFKCVMPKVLFGAGHRADVGEEACQWGARVFLAVDPQLRNSGVEAEITKSLMGSSLTVFPFSDIQPDPDCFAVDRAAAVCRGGECDLVVAAGGGSAIDFGKGVAVMAGNPGTAWQYTRRGDHTPLTAGPGTLPILALPSTAGTGSEMTHYAVFFNPELREKSTIVTERIIPRVAIVDPELTYSCPPRLTALTGVDALAHSIEAYINIKTTPFARLVAMKAIRLVGAWLERAVANGADTEARARMSWASALAGVAIAHANPTLPHALGQAAGGYLHAPHGASIAACLPAVLRISVEAAPQDFADIAEALRPGGADLPLSSRAARCAEIVEDLLRRIGAATGLGALGLTEADIDRVTQIALTGYFTGISLHPKVVDREQIAAIYRRCIEAGGGT